MDRVRAALQQLLEGHDPYPGVVIDRVWNVVLANPAAARFTALLPPELVTPGVNVFRACLHPDGLAGRTRNFDEWGSYLVGQLRRLKALTNDPGVAELLDEVTGYPTVAALGPANQASGDEPALLVPWALQLGAAELSLFTTLTTFGTPRDITLDEVAIELFYPADEPTARLLAEAGATD